MKNPSACNRMKFASETPVSELDQDTDEPP